MRIGVISDIHGTLPESARIALEGVDRILCAGDIELPQTYWELEAIAPTICVVGNCDRYAQAVLHLSRTASPRLAGVQFFMTHRPEDIGTLKSDVQVVVHGHTHTPRDKVRDGVRYLNPGSARSPRGGTCRSCLILTIDEGEIRDVRFIDLDALESQSPDASSAAE